jgi:hypothetical protein
MHSERSGYAISSFLAGVHSLLLMVLMFASVGDKNFVLNVQWFAWQIPLDVVLVASPIQADFSNPNVSARWHTLIRVLGALGAMVQSIAFAIWATVLWAEQGSDVQPFLPVAITVLVLATPLLFALAWALVAVDRVRRH